MRRQISAEADNVDGGPHADVAGSGSEWGERTARWQRRSWRWSQATTIICFESRTSPLLTLAVPRPGLRVASCELQRCLIGGRECRSETRVTYRYGLDLCLRVQW
jgi:hypothetical protein